MVLIWRSTDLVDHGAIEWEAISRETMEIKVEFVVLCRAKISLLREGLERDRGDNRTLSGNVLIHNHKRHWCKQNSIHEQCYTAILHNTIGYNALFQ